jgi:hypothetical protein
MKKMVLVALVSAFLSLGAVACSNTTQNGNANTARTSGGSNSGGGSSNSNSSHTGAASEAPAIVRAALADAQTITAQHRDITAAQVAEIEQETGTRITNRDHHAYLAFSTAGGARRQTGAATVVEANGRQMVIIYESREGVPYIREVRAEGVPQAFLDQFRGKGHDNPLRIGQDLNAHGLDEAMARAASDAIRQDTRVMQALYGGAHSH